MKRGEKAPRSAAINKYLEVDKPVFIVNRKGKIFDINNTFCYLLGYTREELLNHSLEKFGFFKQKFEKGVQFYFLEIKTKNNETLILDIGILTHIENGKPIFFINTVKDIIKKSGKNKKYIFSKRKLLKKKEYEINPLVTELESIKKNLNKRKIQYKSFKDELKKIRFNQNKRLESIKQIEKQNDKDYLVNDDEEKTSDLFKPFEETRLKKDTVDYSRETPILLRLKQEFPGNYSRLVNTKKKKIAILTVICSILILTSGFNSSMLYGTNFMNIRSGYTFTVSATATWWDCNWSYCKLITIDHTKVQENQINYPVLLYEASDNDLATHAQTDGDDIIFVNKYNSTQFKHEIEKYDSSTGELWAWVNVTSISSTEDTKFYMYYGNPTCNNQQDASGTWGPNYIMVQHLNESAGTIYDSTTNNNDGTNNGGSYNSSSKIEGGYDFDGSDNITINEDPSLNITNSITIEGWVKDPPIIGSEKKLNIVKIIDKKEENLNIIAGSKFVVKRTISAPLETEIIFAALTTPDIKIHEMSVVGKSIYKDMYQRGKPRNKNEEKIEKIRLKLPARLHNLYQICYTQPLIIKDDKLTIEMVFQTTLATNLRQDSRISYLLFSTDNKSQQFDYEATTYLKTPTTLIEGLGFINIFGIFNVYSKEKEFSDKPPLIIHDKYDENIQPLPGTLFHVDRTIDGRVKSNIVIVPMFSESLDLEKIELLDQTNQKLNLEFNINNVNEIENEYELKIENFRKKLPSDTKNLNKFGYSEPFSISNSQKIRFWFRAPSWDEIKQGKKTTYGKISYLVFSNDNVNFFDIENSTWWDSNWYYRKLITLNASLIETDLKNFPILLNLTDSDLSTKAQYDGDDIAFVLYSDNSTQLNHEIESFDGVTGKLIAWINVTNLSSSENTKFWMYYGNSQSINQQNPTGVWDSNYVSIHHLNESGTGIRYDSTIYSTDGNTSGYDGDEDINGVVDGADSFTGDFDEYIFIEDTPILDINNNITLEAWINVDDDKRKIGKSQFSEIIDKVYHKNGTFIYHETVNVASNIYATVYRGYEYKMLLTTYRVENDGSFSNTIDTFVFDGAGGTTPNIINIDGNIYLIAYRMLGGSAGMMKTINITNDGSVNGIIDSLIFDGASCEYPEILHISGDVYSLIYAGSGNDGYAKTYHISDEGIINKNMIDVLEFDTTQGRYPAVTKVGSSNHYAISYRGEGDDGYLTTIYIESDGSIGNTINDTFEFNGTSCTFSDIKPTSGDYYAVAFQGAGNDGHLFTIGISATDGDIDPFASGIIDEIIFDSLDALYPRLNHISGNYYSITYTGSGSDGFLKTVDIVSGWNIGSVQDSIEWDTTNGYEPNIYHISGNYYGISYRGDYYHFEYVTVEIASNGQITDSLIETEPVLDDMMYYSDMISLSNDIFVMAYAGEDFDGYLSTFKINNMGHIIEIDNYEYENNRGRFPDLYALSSDKIILVYEDASSDGFISTYQIFSNGTINTTEIDSWEYDTTQGQYAEIFHISGDIYAIAYSGSGSDGYVSTYEIFSNGSINKTTIDFFEFDGTLGRYPSVVRVGNTDNFAIAYHGPDDDGYLITIQILSNGSVGDVVNDSYEFDTSAATMPSIVRLSDGYYAVAYAGSGSDGYLFTVDIDSDGNIGTAIESIEYDNYDGRYPVLLNVTMGKYAIVHTGSGNDGWIHTFDIDTSNGNIITEIDRFEYNLFESYDITAVQVSGSLYAIAYRTLYQDGQVITLNIQDTGEVSRWVNFADYTYETSLIEISDKNDIYAVAYRGPGNDGYISTFRVNSTNGTVDNTTIDTFEFDEYNGYMPKIIHISGETYVIAYRGNGSDAFLKTVQITNNGDVVKVNDTYESYMGTGSYPDIIHVTGNIYATAYLGNGNDPYVATFTITDDGQITEPVEDTQAFSSRCYNNKIINIHDDVFAICYSGPGTDGWIETFTISSDGTINYPEIDSFEFNETYGNWPDIIHVSNDTYAIFYTASGNDGIVATVNITKDGQISNSVIDEFLFDGSIFYPEVISLGSNIFGVIYTGLGNDGFLSAVKIYNDGQIDNNYLETFEFELVNCYYPEILYIGNNTCAITYRGNYFASDDGTFRTLNIITTKGIGKDLNYKINSDSEFIYGDINGHTISTTIASEWNHIVLTYNQYAGSNQQKLYINGILKETNNLSESIDTNFWDLKLGQYFDGTFDEFRLSNIVRNSSWINTTYNTIHYQSDFILHIGNERKSKPTQSNPIPENESVDIKVPPSSFNITLNDDEGDLMTIYWRTNESGTWETFNITDGGGDGVGNGTYGTSNTSWVDSYLTNYWWSVNVSDGVTWSNATYHFTTQPQNFAPTIFVIYPINGSNAIDLQPTCEIWVNDTDGDTLNVSWYDNSTGPGWILRQVNNSVSANNTLNWTYSQANNYLETYYWKVTVNDSTYNITQWFYFTTKSSDNIKPSSNVSSITRYWHNESDNPLIINSTDAEDNTGGDGLKNLTLFYYNSTDNNTWSGPWNFGTDENPWIECSWNFNFPNGSGWYRFYSIARDNASPPNTEDAPIINDTECGYDSIKPSSSVDTIDTEFVATSPFLINATVSDFHSGVKNVTLWYRHYTGNHTPIAWLQGYRLFDDSTNLNQNTFNLIKFENSSVNTTYFNYSSTHPTRLTVKKNGDYLIAFALPLERTDSNDARTCIEADIFVNDSKQDIGVARSSYIRMGSGHSESSDNFHVLLEDLEQDQYIEIKVKGITSIVGDTYPVIVTNQFSLYAEYISNSETIFTATATETTNPIDSTDLNDPIAYKMKWIESRKDSGYTHSDVTNPENITIDSIGNYLVYVNIPLGSTAARSNIHAEIRLNDIQVSGGQFKQGYIRNANSHVDSSIHWSGFIQTTSINEKLSVSVQEEANSGLVTVDNEKATIYVQKLPDDEIYVGRGTELTGGTDWNPATKDSIKWENDDVIDTKLFTHSTSTDPHNITVKKNGDYLLIFNAAFSASSARVNPKITVQVNGIEVEGAETKSNYIRNADSHTESSCSLVLILENLTVNDNITVYTEREGPSGTVNDDTDAILILWRKHPDWMQWNGAGNPDTNSPWQWNFNFPEGYGTYEFFSVATDNASNKEDILYSADATCKYNRLPIITNEGPTNGSTNVPLIPQMNITVADLDSQVLTIKWYSNSSGSWEIFGVNSSVLNGTFHQKNSNFSNSETKYWWYVTVYDGMQTNTSDIFYFTTLLGNVTVITNTSTNIEETDATLHGQLQDDGGELCTVRFEYGTTQAYGTNTSNQIKSGGELFSANINSLIQGQLYHFRAYANNSVNSDVGDDLTFLTKPNPPSNLNIQANNSTVLFMTWVTGTGANNTYIERNTTQNWDRGEGTLVYNGTGTLYEDSNLIEGIVYYYKAWSFTNWTFNGTYIKWSDTNESNSSSTEKIKPSIQFIPPTPNNNTKTGDTFAFVNVSISDASSHSSFINWNNTLVGYWNFEYTNSTGVYDNSTNSNFATFNGSDFGQSNITRGKYGNAIEFDGINDYLEVNTSSSLDSLGQNVTISGWINISEIGAGGNSRTIWNFYKSDTDRVHLKIDDQHLALFNDIDDIGSLQNSGDIIDINNWYYVTATVNGTIWTVYLNDDSTPKIYFDFGVNFSDLDDGFEVWFGFNHAGGNQRMEGLMDEIMIWNRTLSLQEIKALYNSKQNQMYNNFSGLSIGNYTFYAQTIDTAGMINFTDTYNFEVGLNDNPVIDIIYPFNNSVNIVTQPTCQIWANDSDGDTLTVCWYENSTGPGWILRQVNNSVAANSIVNWTFTQASNENTVYYWRVSINDSIANMTEWFVFTTISYDLPNVTTNSSTGIEETNATLWGYLIDDGNASTTCGFWWDIISGGTTNNYTVGTISEGDTFNYNAQGLTPGQLYYFKAWANNSAGFYDSENEQTFLTKPNETISLTVQANSSSVIYLTWITGDGANTTYIERNTTPNWDIGDGIFVYNGTKTIYEDTSLNNSTTYYYQAWSYANWTNPKLFHFSDLNLSGSNTTKNKPEITNIYPVNESTGIPLNPTTSLQLNHSDGYQMNITWYWGLDSSTPNLFGTNNSVTNGSYQMTNTNFTSNSITYYWRVTINDGHGEWTNETYHFTTIAGNKIVLTKSTNAYSLEINPTGTTLYGYINSNSVSASIDTNWHYVALTYDGANIRLYKDGEQVDITGYIGSINTNSNMLIAGEWLTGTLDELRISNTQRTSAWINTTYQNTNNPTTFATFGPQQGILKTWAYRKKIWINASMLDTDLTNFPVLISTTDTDLKNNALSTGNDIIFTNSTVDWTTSSYTNRLPHEIELYTTSTGELIAWVNVTYLSSTTNTSIYMYYGNTFCADNIGDRENVWNSNFSAVWHLNETPSNDIAGHIDSTINNFDATPKDFDGTSDSTTDATGKIDGADRLDGTNDWIDLGNFDFLTANNFTISMWINADLVTSDDRIISSYAPGDASALSVRFNSNKIEIWQSEWDIITTSSFISGDWIHLTLVIEDDTATAFINGSEELSATQSGGSFDVNTLGLGEQLANNWGNHFDGYIDEVRISNISRNSSWINATYKSMNDSSAFLDFGPQEIQNLPPTQSNPSPVNNAVGQELNPTLSITVNDQNQDTMNVTFRTNATGSWLDINTNSSVGNGTYSQTQTNMNSYGTKYWWSVNVTDETLWNNRTYSFTTYNKITLRPNAVGRSTQLTLFTSGGDTNNWETVDEATYNGDVNYVYTENQGSWINDTYNLTNPSASGTINNITITLCHKYAGTSGGPTPANQINLTMYDNIAGEYYESATSQALTNNYVNTSWVYSTNPITSTAWTWAELTDLEVGLSLIGTENQYSRCTQVYVEVYYY